MTPRATPARLVVVLGVLVVVLAGVLLAAAASGPAGGLTADSRIVFQLRLPRAIVAALVGGALSICGATFQAVLRNPLASPCVIGV